MSKKNIVVVGAGFAGVAAAKKLSRHFKKKSGCLDHLDRQTFLPNVHDRAA